MFGSLHVDLRKMKLVGTTTSEGMCGKQTYGVYVGEAGGVYIYLWFEDQERAKIAVGLFRSEAGHMPTGIETKIVVKKEGDNA